MNGKIAASGNVNSLLIEDEEKARTMILSGRNFCYYGLFQGCTSLTQAPELPATTLAEGCYSNMFEGCSNLNTIKLGYTGNFADAPTDAFTDWVSGVASTGTFYYNGDDKTTGPSAIPDWWTVSPWVR